MVSLCAESKQTLSRAHRARIQAMCDSRTFFNAQALVRQVVMWQCAHSLVVCCCCCCSSTLKVDMVINTINAPTASKSSWVVVAVTISESTTGQKVAGQKVQLMVTPNRKAVVCQSYKLTTNSNGVATTNCQLAKASSTTITARAAGVTTTKSFKAAKTRP